MLYVLDYYTIYTNVMQFIPTIHTSRVEIRPKTGRNENIITNFTLYTTIFLQIRAFTPKIHGKPRKYSNDNMTLYVSKTKLKYFKCKVYAMQIMCLIDIIIQYRRNLYHYFQYMQ
jgi:hypothetical protein